MIVQYNRLNELVQQNNIRESTYKIIVDILRIDPL
jgi:hypothetical protein